MVAVEVYVALNGSLAGIALATSAASLGTWRFLRNTDNAHGTAVYLLITFFGLSQTLTLAGGTLVLLSQSDDVVDVALFSRDAGITLCSVIAVLIMASLVPGLRVVWTVSVVAVIGVVAAAVWFPTDLIVEHGADVAGLPVSGPASPLLLVNIVGPLIVGVSALRKSTRHLRVLIGGGAIGTTALLVSAMILREGRAFEEVATLITSAAGLALVGLLGVRVRRTAEAQRFQLRQQGALARLGEAALIGVDVDATITAAQDELRREFGSDTITVEVDVDRSPVVAAEPVFDAHAPVIVRGRMYSVRTEIGRELTVDSWSFCRTLLRVVATTAERLAVIAVVAHGSTHDQQTGLANQELFLQHVAEHLDEGESSEVVVVLCRVEGLARVGAVRGSEVAADAVRLVVDLLTGLADPSTFLARLATDEFALVGRARHPDTTGYLVHRLAGLEAGLTAGLRDSGVRALLGAAAAEPGTSAEVLLRHARTALDRAVEGRRTEIFNDDIRESLTERFNLQRGLQRAVERDEIEVRYQPIVRAGVGTVVAYEALSRWRRGDELVPPDRWIPIAESTGLISDIGRRVLEIACRDGACLDQPVAVNVSPLQLADPGFPDAILDLLAGGVDPRRLHLEITESAIVADVERSVRVLETVRSAGVRVALDDFGTSYSSLSSLVELPVDTIKIDRSFVRRANTASGRSVIAAVVTLAGTLDVAVVAEGIESLEQLHLVTELGVDFVQGFYTGRPVSIDRLRRSEPRQRPQPRREAEGVRVSP